MSGKREGYESRVDAEEDAKGLLAKNAGSEYVIMEELARVRLVPTVVTSEKQKVMR
jgi:hypothetical protein